MLEWCRAWVNEKGEKYLAAIAQDPRNKGQLEAIKTIFAYGIGKPVEFVEASHQFEGVGPDPEQAKEFLGQLITGAAPGGVGEGSGSGASPDSVPPPLLDTERGAS